VHQDQTGGQAQTVQMGEQDQTEEMALMVLLALQEVTEGPAQDLDVCAGDPWKHPKGNLWTHREVKKEQVIFWMNKGHGHRHRLEVAERRFV
jgi:hypothetical protein